PASHSSRRKGCSRRRFQLSGLNPEALITGPHLLKSALWMSASWEGPSPVGSIPSASSFSRTSGALSASMMALASRSTVAFGVSAGALDGVAEFAERRDVGKFARAARARSRKHAQLAGLVLRSHVGDRAHERGDLAAEQVGERRGGAFVADVVHPDARGLREKQREE